MGDRPASHDRSEIKDSAHPVALVWVSAAPNPNHHPGRRTGPLLCPCRIRDGDGQLLAPGDDGTVLVLTHHAICADRRARGHRKLDEQRDRSLLSQAIAATAKKRPGAAALDGVQIPLTEQEGALPCFAEDYER
ncbi:hypothetical protein [Streptomyces venetus]|uniref:hypothetical protein n=1 Tax=Streptomyces venetus TaxID=1701086 RepID=UPI003C2F9166